MREPGESPGADFQDGIGNWSLGLPRCRLPCGPWSQGAAGVQVPGDQVADVTDYLVEINSEGCGVGWSFLSVPVNVGKENDECRA